MDIAGLCAAAVSVAKIAYERVKEVEGIVGLSGDLRDSLIDLQEFLESVVTTFGETIKDTIYHDPHNREKYEYDTEKFESRIRRCEELCRQVNEILISIRTASRPRIKAYKKLGNLQRLGSELQTAKENLTAFVPIIS